MADPKERTPSAEGTAGRAKIIEEARALLHRYEPEQGVGASLASPSQGEARRMLLSVRALLSLIEPGPNVTHQEVKLETR